MVNWVFENVDFVGMVIPGHPVGITNAGQDPVTTKAAPIQLIMAVRIPNNSLLAVVGRRASALRSRTIAPLDHFLATLPEVQ
jgi:hypothetical protein